MFLLLDPFSAPSVKILIYMRDTLYWKKKLCLRCDWAVFHHLSTLVLCVLEEEEEEEEALFTL